MQINVRNQENKFVFELDGSLDIYTSLDLKMALEDNITKPNSDVCINLDRLTYIDSSGIGILIKSLNFVQGLSGNMCVANLKPVIEKVFKVSGLTTYFEILTHEDYTNRYAGF